MGRQYIGAVVNFVCYYVVGLPVGIGLGLGAHMGALGIWIGISCGNVLQVMFISTCNLSRSNLTLHLHLRVAARKFIVMCHSYVAVLSSASQVLVIGSASMDSVFGLLSSVRHTER